MLTMLVMSLTIAADDRQVIGAEPEPDDVGLEVTPESQDPVDVSPSPPRKQALPRRAVPADAPSAKRSLDGPKPDPIAVERRATAIRTGSCVGCLSGGAVAGVASVGGLYGSTTGNVSCLIVTGIFGAGCGLCSSLGATTGAIAGAATAGVDVLTLSPWLLTGLLVGAAAAAVPIGIGVLSTMGVQSNNLNTMMTMMFLGLTVAAGPTTVISAFLTEPTEVVRDDAE